MFQYVKSKFLNVKGRVQENSLESIIWLINIMPSWAGFSILQDKIYAPFWILHITLVVYVYGAGTAVFQIKHAEGVGDFIKGYVNITIIIMISQSSYWFLKERLLLKTVLGMVEKSDELSREFPALRQKHEKRLSVIKKIEFVFYGWNTVNACIYVPLRVDISNNLFSMTPCVGIAPLTTTPNKQICTVILTTVELTNIIVVLNYQAVLLFLIAHTTSMYQMISDEIIFFDNTENVPNIDNMAREKLPVFIRRHALILEIIKGIKSLYSVPLGVNFGSNVVCICLFFYLPLREWLQYSPILIYCLMVFFLYCYLCQRLINAAEGFERAVYSCGWEKFQVNEMKLVYVMLLQAQKPISILAADIIPVNIYTFATTLQTIFKFVTVVKF